MKKILSILLSLSMVLMLCACNKNVEPSGGSIDPDADTSNITTPEDVIITTEELLSYYDFDINDYVKLGDYKNVEVNLTDTYEISDQTVIDYINMYLSYYGDVVESDRTVVQNGDIVTIDFAGKIDGIPFEGGTATGYQVTIGSQELINGFEEGIIGHSKDEEFVLNLRFPTPYEPNETYSGKDVEFTVVVTAIYEEKIYTYSTLTDEYVSDTFGLDTVDEYVTNTKAQMQANADSQKYSDAEKAFLNNLLDICEVTIPDGYMDTYCAQVMEQVKSYAIDSLGVELETYIQEYEGYDTVEEFEASLREQLKTETKQQFILDAIIKAESITITQTGFDDFVDYYLMLYGLTEEEFYNQYGSKESIMLIYAENYLLADLMERVTINVGVSATE